MNFTEKREEFVGPFCILSADKMVVEGYNNLTWGEALDGLIKLRGVFPQENFLMVDSTGIVVLDLAQLGGDNNGNNDSTL